MPGVVFSLAAWMILSAAYSFYVENFANYSVIYGTLGAMIVLLIWLYLTAIVLIMGAELNDTLLVMREENARRQRRRQRSGGAAEMETEKGPSGPSGEEKAL